MTTLRAQDAPRFRVMAGQRWTGDDGFAWRIDDGDVKDGANPAALYTLDEPDPATLGTVEAMVREAWAGHSVHITEYQRPDHYHVEIDRAGPDGFPVGAWAGHAPTRHEAWAAALHAAPEGA